MLAGLTVTGFAVASPGVSAPSERDLPLIVSGQPAALGSSVWDSAGAVPDAPAAVEMTVAAAPSGPSSSGHPASAAAAPSGGHAAGTSAGRSSSSSASTGSNGATVTRGSGTKAKKKDSAHAYEDADHEVVVPRLHESDEHKRAEHFD